MTVLRELGGASCLLSMNFIQPVKESVTGCFRNRVPLPLLILFVQKADQQDILWNVEHLLRLQTTHVDQQVIDECF